MSQRVHIEFQRVQTWLFAVPRLRAMVGANAMIGEVLRQKLPDEAKKQEGWKLEPLSDAESYPGIDADDPLKAHDDPRDDARQGILSRDGGHFEADFDYGADKFIRRADKLLRTELPGLRFRISIDKVEKRSGTGTRPERDLPVFAVCEWTGRGVASKRVKQGDEKVDVSVDVDRRHQAAKRTEPDAKKPGVDLASLLVPKTKLRSTGQRPEMFSTLASGGYLAVIHADGNGVGAGAGAREDRDQAEFFHRNRVLLRRAVAKAMDKVADDELARRAKFEADRAKGRYRRDMTLPENAPIIPLMLGGDDLLIVCRAAVALPFVVALCAALDKIQQDDAPRPLTLGVGVVIAKPTIPFHRLHEVAEQLTTSAKRRYRATEKEGGKPVSLVDWAVYSTSWVGDPTELRGRDWVCGSAAAPRVLSQRPIPVVGADLATLAGLVDAAKELDKSPRSQLRHLVEQLPKGKQLADLALHELSPAARKALEKAGIKKTVWDESGRKTALRDLVEIAEIPHLGSLVRPRGKDDPDNNDDYIADSTDGEEQDR